MGIAVIGISCAFPGAPNPDSFWNNILSGVESLTRLSQDDLLAAGEDAELIRTPEYVPFASCIEDIDLFDAEFFGLTPREAERTDPQHRLFMEHCWRAIENAGYDPRRIPGPVGVYAGQGPSTYIRNLRSQVDWAASARDGERWEHVGALESELDYLAPKVSYHMGLTGPSVPISTACSTSLVAVHLACQALRTFECDAALAGGIAIAPPLKRGYLYIEGGIASADGHTRTFDARSTGTLFGSGVGVVLLKRLEDAVADGDRITGVIMGSAINNDGAMRAGFSTPSVDGQAEVIAQAQALAGVHPDTITYVEAHGTGTPVGDPIEVAALTKAFREGTDRRGYCALGSVKANIGHMDAAAGVAGLIKALYATREGVIPPQVNFAEANPALRLDESPFRIATEREAWRTPAGVPRRAGVSSFGIGGTNAHVVIEQPPAAEREAMDEAAGWQVLPVSARDGQALGEALGQLADALEGGSVRLGDAAFTLQRGRTRFACRAAVAAPDRAAAAAALRRRQGMPFPDRPTGSVGFLFPGQGAHYPGMARGLYDGFPGFASAFDRCAESFSPLLGHDLAGLVLRSAGRPEQELLERTRFIQPALFAVEYSLALALIGCGVKPDAMLGHSMGEFVAATVSGVLSPQDAARVIDERARLMDEAPPGAMLSVPLPASAIELPEGVTIAAYNGPRLVTVAGQRAALDEMAAALAAAGVTCRPLRVPHALHSPALARAAEQFASFMAGIKVEAPRIPFISNVTGTWVTEEDIRSPGYWGRQMSEPVRFEQGLANLASRIDGSLVEVGPGRGMLSLAQGAAAGRPGRLVQAMRSSGSDEDDLQVLHDALARVWENGAEPSWPALASGGRRDALPGYAFQRKRYWLDLAPERAVARPGAAPPRRGLEDWFYSPAWRTSAAVGSAAATADGARSVILVGAAGEFTEAAATMIAAAGQVATLVEVGSGPNPGAELSRALDGAAGATVVFAAAVDGRAASRAQCAAELLDVTRALAGRDATRLGLLVLTCGAFDVCGDEPINAGHAVLAGIAKVIPKELGHVSCRAVDLDSRADAGHAASCLLRELGEMPGDLVVAYRGGRRWAQDVEHLRVTAASGQGAPLRENGAYLITGGMGGIGLSLGAFLAREYRARLVLSGRNVPPAPSLWDDWLSQHDDADPVSRQILALRAMMAVGGTVTTVPCDVTDPAAVRGLLGECARRLGRLDGVVHAAGLGGSGRLIEDMAAAELEASIAPKVAGADALLAATEDAGLDFLALFSSLSTVDSWDGAADYAAGNAYLDALAHQARRRGRGDVIAIDWTGWLRTGMNAGDQAPAESPDYLAEAEGHAALKVALSTRLPQVHVAVHDLEVAMRQARGFASGAEPARTWPTAPAGRAGAGGGEAVRRGPARAIGDRAAAEDPLEAQVSDAFRWVLGVDGIGPDDNFFELGGNSLLALDLVGRVRREHRAKILLRDFFSAPTVRGLASLADTGMERGSDSEGGSDE